MRLRHGMNRNHGLTLIYAVVTISALMMVVSLGVDFGRVQLVKTELRCASDAAARAAAGQIANGVSAAESAAVNAAAANLADGAAVTIDSASDVEFGTWDSGNKTFTVLSGAARGNANAIRVYARRTASRGNAVSLMFARVLGREYCDVTARSIVMATPTSGGGSAGIGLNSILIENSGKVDSYSSAAGTYSAGAATSQAVLQSNGDINLKNTARVNGAAHPGPGDTVSLQNQASVSGTTSALSQEMSYDNVNAGSASSSNDNSSIPGAYFSSNKFELENNESYTLPGGTYYFSEFKIKNNSVLNVSGNATIYVTDKVEIENHGQVSAYLNRPGNLQIKVIGSGGVKIKNNTALAASIYAPQSDFELENSAELYGGVIAKSIKIKNNAEFHYDTSLGSGSSSSSVALAVVE